MAEPQTLRDRYEYLNSGLQNITCDRCGSQVRVKKNSPQHTSVQWTPAAVRECEEFAARAAAGEPTALIATCASLRASIERAVRDGRLDVALDVAQKETAP